MRNVSEKCVGKPPYTYCLYHHPAGLQSSSLEQQSRKEKKKYVLSDNFSMAYTAGEQYCFKQGKSASIRAVTQINFCLAWKTCFHDVCISFCSNSNTFPMMTITVLFRKPVTWLILFVYL